MTPTETVKLTRYVAALCPAQKIDEFTADTWHDVVADLRLEDARSACVRLAKRQPFIAPSEICDEVRDIRHARLDACPVPEPPAEIRNDPLAVQSWLRSATKVIADGRAAELPALTPAIVRRAAEEAAGDLRAIEAGDR
jgi:hypothetical protein